ncbi:isoprenyl transferase [Kordiimonas sediminis]|uniref:Isoprenyl transferase n=1 Tax=Kordiimonas sediminis TaxID=1735581 RepID=A0A919E9X0_9PROT|nr:isoprenyl transferase [Kordiimonas sediminis]GHF28509.1 isoprenyl transferase [Kordiimonas sediminis]
MVPDTTSAAYSSSQSVPQHVAVIMDGNGRWAVREKVSRGQGHKKGSEAVRQAIEGAVEAGVSYLTLYAFSSENWNRPQEEVSDLMGLLRFYLSREIKRLHKEGIKLKVIGHRERLAEDIQKMVAQAEALTADNSRLTLVIALSYGAREEITEAAKHIAAKVQSGDVALEDISEDLVSSSLQTKGIPDPDLIIRTSGEQRLSNFLLWQAAYAEFLFLDVLWPDFTKEIFHEAVQNYLTRERRYGARP